MKIVIDTAREKLALQGPGEEREIPLYSAEAFACLSREWLRVGWNQKYTYRFTWLGRPVIQMPEDLLRIQEVIHRVRPEVLIETGVAHGGSLVFYASLFHLIGVGRVIGVDIEIRSHNRRAIEAHPLAPMITLIEGDSIAEETISNVRSLVRSGESVMVILDSCHTKQHVLRELEAYHHLVSRGSYLIAADGIMHDLASVPRGQASWTEDNPKEAVKEFVRAHPEFVCEPPALPFDESLMSEGVTYWGGGWLRRT
jgi:cephalosporin hydroxylase